MSQVQVTQQETTMEEAEGKSNYFFNKWDLAVWIAPVPILGYGITFSYEFGVSMFYQYPISFISLEPTLVAKNSLYLIFAVLGILIALLTLSPIISLMKQKIRLTKPIFLSFVVLSINYILTTTFLDSNHTRIDETWMLIPSSIIAFIFYMLYKSYYLSKKIRAIIPLVLVVLLVFPGVLGYMNAVNKTTYYVIDGKKENYVVLNFVKDKLLIAPVDLKTHTITSTYSLIDAKTDFEPNNDKVEQQLNFVLVETESLSIGKVKTAKELLESRNE